MEGGGGEEASVQGAASAETGQLAAMQRQLERLSNSMIGESKWCVRKAHVDPPEQFALSWTPAPQTTRSAHASAGWCCVHVSAVQRRRVGERNARAQARQGIRRTEGARGRERGEESE